MTEQKKTVNVLSNATKHYKAQIAGDMNNFEVPEWDTTIYYRTVTNLKAETEIVELSRQGKSTEALVMSIINKARKDDGSLMFSKHDKDVFMNEVDPKVVLRVASRLNGDPLPQVSEVVKN
jgi:hypothetical protein